MTYQIPKARISNFKLLNAKCDKCWLVKPKKDMKFYWVKTNKKVLVQVCKKCVKELLNQQLDK